MKMELFLLLMVCALAGCGNKTPQPSSGNISTSNAGMLQAAAGIIQSGDIILRSGKDITSYRIRELSDQDKTYSHAGIACVRNDSVLIYHITPPDIDEPIADTAIRLETLQQFADPARCFGFGIARYPLSAAEIKTAMHYLDSLYAAKTPFDHYFNLEDNKTMYCSEMVDNTLRHATAGRIRLKRKHFTRLQAIKAARYFHSSLEEVNRRAFIPIDCLQLDSSATMVHQYVFLK